jgi:predicted metalloendopeptidase
VQARNHRNRHRTGPAATAAAPVSGIDLTGVDKSVKPGDDFDAYANGAWRKTFEIPEDRSNYARHRTGGDGGKAQRRTHQ